MENLFEPEEPKQQSLTRYVLLAVRSNGLRELLSDVISSEENATEQARAWLRRLQSFGVEIVEINIPLTTGLNVTLDKEMAHE